MELRAKLFRGFQVDNPFDPVGLNHWQITGAFALQDSSGIKTISTCYRSIHARLAEAEQRLKKLIAQGL
jgi:hypothetical protein